MNSATHHAQSKSRVTERPRLQYGGCVTPTTPPEVESEDAHTKRNIVLECESPQ